MATTTPKLGLQKPAVGDDKNAWGGMWNSNADILDGVVSSTSGGDVSGPLNWIATNSVALRSAQNRSADSLNVLDYILPADTDATAGFNRAVAAALALNRPATIDIPAGTYNISGPINITTAGSQGVYLRGAGASTTVIFQNADADGIVMLATNTSGQAGNGGLRVSGIALRMASTAPATTTRTALKLSTTATTGNASVPIVVDDVQISSSTTTSLWGRGLVLERISAAITFVSRISITYPSGTHALGLGTGITIQGVPGQYTAGINMRDCGVIEANVAYLLGDFMQGVHLQNLNTIYTTYALTYIPTVSGANNLEIHITDSYLHGKTVFGNAAFPNALNTLTIASTYFDATSTLLSANDKHVSFINVPVVTVTGCTFSGSSTSVANISGLYVTGPANDGQVFTGNIFGGYLNGGTAIELTSDTHNMLFTGNTLLNNTNRVADAGARNEFVNTYFGSNVYYVRGNPSTTPSQAALMAGPVTIVGLLTANGGLGVTGNVNVLGTTNNFAVQGSTAGNPVQLQAFGSDADISIRLLTKGAGLVSFTGPVKMMNYTVATLPAPSAAIACHAYVTDHANSAPVWNAAPTAGGSTRVKVWSDGTSWRVY